MLPPSPPVRLTLREVSDADLTAKNRAERRRGVARFRSGPATVVQVRRATLRSATPDHLATWAAHPDERVAFELATHRGGIQGGPLLPVCTAAPWPPTTEEVLVNRALADADAEGVIWTLLLDTLCVERELTQECWRYLGNSERLKDRPRWAEEPLARLAAWAQCQPDARGLVALLQFKSLALQRRIWAAAAALDDETLACVLEQPSLRHACAGALGLAANPCLSSEHRLRVATWALSIVTAPCAVALSRGDAECVATVLQAVGDVLAQSPQLLARLWAAAIVDRGQDEAAHAATIALLGNPAMTPAALEDLFAAKAPTVSRSPWTALRPYLEHRCATPALWRRAARAAVACGHPTSMFIEPAACRDPEVREILYGSGDGRTAAELWACGATPAEFARTFGALAGRAALPDTLEAYADIPEAWWAALPPDAWAPLARLLTSARHGRDAHLFTTLLARIPAARRDQRVWMFVRRRHLPDGPDLEPAVALVADPDAGPAEQRRELLLACLAADPDRTLAAAEDTPALATLLHRTDLTAALESPNTRVRERAFGVLARLRPGGIGGPGVAPGC